MKLKNAAYLLAAAACACSMTGCADSTELGNRAIIQAAAIDYDNGYKVSALLFSSGGSGGDTIDASQENVIKVTGEGKTLSEAIDNISLIDGKRLYMSETKLLILGGGFEDTDVTDALNTLYYDLRCSLNMPVCSADNAEMLTDLQFTEGVTAAEKPLAMIENAYRLGVSPKTTLLDVLADTAGGRSTLIPYFEPTVNGRGMTLSDSGKTAALNGTRELSDGCLGKRYGQARTAGLMLINGLSDKLTVNYIHDGVEKTCEAYSIKVTEAVTSQSGRLTVSARFKTRSGGTLSQSERQAALKVLTSVVELAAQL